MGLRSTVARRNRGALREQAQYPIPATEFSYHRKIKIQFSNLLHCSYPAATGSVSEPINPESWRWYRDVIGPDKLPVVDT